MKTIEPLPFYEKQYNKSSMKLFQQLNKKMAKDDETPSEVLVAVDYLDSLHQLLNELTYSVKKLEKQQRKNRKKK